LTADLRGYAVGVAEQLEPFERILETLKKAAGALREAEVPFLLGGGIACWARGGPESEHDLDLMLRKPDADRALEVLGQHGMQIDKPPEGWLYKAFDDGVMVDLIFEPSGQPIEDAVFERAEEMNVSAVPMRVMSLEDVLVTKLSALREHELDYDSLVEIARALREQIDWEDVRRRTGESPYAKAFFTLIEELGIVERPS
jgi:predicted nucleotidyltransferase